MLIISHVWPGITPLNVWQLTWADWLMYAHAADEWAKAREKGADDG